MDTLQASIFRYKVRNNNKHRCAQTRRKDIVTTGDRCNHWPLTIVTTGVTTDLSLYSQFTLCSLKQQTDWHITTLLLYPCMVKLSKNSDWSAYYLHIHTPFSLIGQLVPHILPALWLVSHNEHMLLCEWAHNNGEIQLKIKMATDRHGEIQIKSPDWSMRMGPYTLPDLWLANENEHMLLFEWAHNHGEIQW